MWYMICFVICLILIGLIVNIIDIRKKVSDYNFTNEYYEKFTKLISEVLKTKKFKSDEYTWLVSNVDKMQYILGETGIVSYKEFNMFYKNVPILLNVINEITSYAKDSYVSNNDITMVNWCQTAFLRKIGILNDYIESHPKKLINPFFNLSTGINYILSIPLNILYDIGLISYSGKNKIKQNILFKIISGIISLLTILSVIMTIVVGWNDFVNIVKNIVSKISI